MVRYLNVLCTQITVLFVLFGYTVNTFFCHRLFHTHYTIICLRQYVCIMHYYAMLWFCVCVCVCVVGQQGISMTIIVCVNMINRWNMKVTFVLSEAPISASCWRQNCTMAFASPSIYSPCVLPFSCVGLGEEDWREGGGGGWGEGSVIFHGPFCRETFESKP